MAAAAMLLAAEMTLLAQAPTPGPAPGGVPPGAPKLATTEGRRDRDRDRARRSYEKAMKLLEERQWDPAIQELTEAAAGDATRADGALYWKSYALKKSGQLDQALATLKELEKSHPNSRWLNDVKALEVEVRQAAGRPVSPEEASDEDLKLMALNALVHSDPERALPLLEKLLRGANSPKLKERALFVLRQSRSPKARDMLVAVARESNPDLQMKAIHALGIMGGTENRQALADLYAGAADAAVKRAILRSFMVSGEWERLLDIAKGEKDTELRKEAVRQLGIMGKRSADALAGLYGTETDKAVRREVLNALFIQNNAKALVDIARKETDRELKTEAVSKLSHMRNKEATDFMMELLEK